MVHANARWTSLFSIDPTQPARYHNREGARQDAVVVAINHGLHWGTDDDFADPEATPRTLLEANVDGGPTVESDQVVLEMVAAARDPGGVA